MAGDGCLLSLDCGTRRIQDQAHLLDGRRVCEVTRSAFGNGKPRLIQGNTGWMWIITKTSLPTIVTSEQSVTAHILSGPVDREYSILLRIKERTISVEEQAQGI